MRYLLLAAAATLALTGAAIAQQSAKNVKGAHYRDANASTASFFPPNGTGSDHTMRVKNLRASGYNPAGDRDARGNMKNN